MSERNLSVLVHSLFSAWMLAFLFEGQILLTLVIAYALSPELMIVGGISALFAGAFSCGFFIKTKKAARRLFLISYPIFLVVSLCFFFPPTVCWPVGILTGSFLAGGCVAAWGFYLKSGSPKSERIKMVADMLILSNLLMILLNITSAYISAQVALSASLLMLIAAFTLAWKLPGGSEAGDSPSSAAHTKKETTVSLARLLVYLCLFIVVITITSGLMYQVIMPAFSHLEWLTSWYWAVPYIAALVLIRNLPRSMNRTYMLLVAIAMIGLSFIGFISLNTSAASYLFVNTLMMGACGVYDLFWWSVLGEMLEYHQNSAKILGIGLSANVLGVLLGVVVGNTPVYADTRSLHPTLLALAIVCVTLVLLPPLHKQLSRLLKDQVFLSVDAGMLLREKPNEATVPEAFMNLSHRERQVASLLLHGMTYRAIAGNLYISENTVKYYVKNIYSKLSIKSRAELIELVHGHEDVTGANDFVE